MSVLWSFLHNSFPFCYFYFWPAMNGIEQYHGYCNSWQKCVIERIVHQQSIGLKVPLWSNSRYPFFLRFHTQKVFPDYLAKFQSITKITTSVFWNFISENLAPPLFFLVPILGWKVEWLTSFSQKYRTDLNYNKNKCGKLHEFRGQSFCSSSCELLH